MAAKSRTQRRGEQRGNVRIGRNPQMLRAYDARRLNGQENGSQHLAIQRVPRANTQENT